MGAYLTYVDSESFANTGTPADENYSRELMQVRIAGRPEPGLGLGRWAAGWRPPEGREAGWGREV